MNPNKNKAILLRKDGKSYNEIIKEIKVSKGTLSYWLRDIRLTSTAIKKINSGGKAKSIQALIKRNEYQTTLAKERADTIRKESEISFVKKNNDPLFISGLCLYWAEGYKKGATGSKWKTVDFVNSDPEMIGLMMKFFNKTCGIPLAKIKAQLIAHPNININKSIRFWCNLTKIPKNNFIRTYCKISKSSKQKRSSRTLTHGTLHVRINDVSFFFKIIGWIDGLKKYLGTIAQR